MKSLMFFAAALMSSLSYGQQALGEIIGEVRDANTNEVLIDVHVFVIDNDKKYQTRSDLDGRFRISAVPAGTYVVNFRYKNDTLLSQVAEVPMDGFYNAGIVSLQTSTDSLLTLKTFTFKYSENIVLVDGNLPVATLTAKEIDKSPAKFDIKGLVSSMSSEVRQTEDGELVFRGARKGDMIYLVDGVKTRDAGSLPGVAIGRMQVYTGGLPAKYGDTLGGVVVLETKSYFDLYRQWMITQ